MGIKLFRVKMILICWTTNCQIVLCKIKFLSALYLYTYIYVNSCYVVRIVILYDQKRFFSHDRGYNTSSTPTPSYFIEKNKIKII